MKPSGLLAFVLCLAPTLVSAQQPPPGPPPDAPGSSVSGDNAANQQRFAAMQQVHQQMRQMHEQARSQILSALSTQHRTLIANLVGGFSVANNPDPAGAARQIDALLSPGEKQAVVNIHTAERTSERNLMQAQRTQFEASMTAEQRAKMQQREAQRQSAAQAHPHIDDAGTIVLRTLAHVGGPGEGMMMHRR